MALSLDGAAKRDAIAAIQEHFRADRGEALGELAATLLLQFVEAELAPVYYNAGVRDASALVARLSATMAEELEYLEVRKPAGRKASGGPR